MTKSKRFKAQIPNYKMKVLLNIFKKSHGKVSIVLIIKAAISQVDNVQRHPVNHLQVATIIKNIILLLLILQTCLISSQGVCDNGHIEIFCK